MDQSLNTAKPFEHGNFDGKVAVITGGTQGLGFATAQLMKARGAAGLLIVGRDVDKGEAAAASLDSDECRAVFHSADLRDEVGVQSVIDRADSEFGVVHSLVSCAAATWRGTVWNTTAAMWDDMLALNVKTPALLVTGMAKIMKREQVPGTMVLIGSVAHHGGNEVLWPYSTSKHALETLVKNAAFSLMTEGIRVNMLNPGWMDTPAEHVVQMTFHDAPEDWLVAAEASQPTGRILKPQEIARGICFLASAESGMMTGISMDFDQTMPGVGDLPRAQPVPEHFDWEES
ncbi:MAG: NAD(P)-dependent dehydrogenase (short-subunit alcohol dehydrogenase family) [Verrucomicrobiales bacterium]|jgi:NAD(P)-dependent dehydrogenase (short-subunit alcohol dehydrogenase family)